MEIGSDLNGARGGADLLASATLPVTAAITASDATTAMNFLSVMRPAFSRIMVVSFINNAPFLIALTVIIIATPVKSFETIVELFQ